jgi:tetratricopeptide (TPR) repeat protein
MDPPRAVALYETLLAGCYEKAGEIDDSSGSFGDFVGQLHCMWMKTRQAAGADPNEIATRLLAWMEADPYGFCHNLANDAAKVLNEAGLAALTKHVRERFDVAGTTKGAPGGSPLRDAAYARRRWGEALRTLYLAQKHFEAYLALAEEMTVTPADCHALATMLVARQKTEDALAWVERGIELARQVPNSSMAGYELSTLKRVLLEKQGRRGEALDAAWGEYCEHPDKYAYAELMKYVPKAERATWHQKAIDAAKDSDLDSLIELFLETKELERLADVVHVSPDKALESASHHVTEPAAKKLEQIHPDVAARL